MDDSPGAAPAQVNPAVMVRVAEYVRMSTEHQQYSIFNQQQVIRQYAERHGLHIARTYEDAGKSGLGVTYRHGLRSLLDDIEHGRSDYTAILVYDVSRWGRFQDIDESAFYEYLCTKAGIRVRYCAESFDNDGSFISSIAKSLRRIMAAELSRDYSFKVSNAQNHLVKLGFHQGGIAGFGIRRLLIDPDRKPKFLLKSRQYKDLQMDRVVLVPGPEDEVAVVHLIYSLYVDHHMSQPAIARALNEAGLTPGLRWTTELVIGVLTNEKYIGNNIRNRTTKKLRGRCVRNPPSAWVRQDGAFEPVVPPALFQAAQAERIRRRSRVPAETVIVDLRSLLEAKGRLTRALIEAEPGLPCATVFQRRFGGFAETYKQLGYVSAYVQQNLKTRKHLDEVRPRLVDEITTRFEQAGVPVTRNPKDRSVTVNGNWTVRVMVLCCYADRNGVFRWNLSRRPVPAAEVTVVGRMDTENQRLHDYFIFPRADFLRLPLSLTQNNGTEIDVFRCDSLDSLFELAQPRRLREVAP